MPKKRNRPTSSPLSERDRALRWALRALGRREYLPEELRQRLMARGFEEAVVAEAIQTLLDQRLLSESRAIAALVESKSGKRAVGRGALRESLLAKGVDEAQLVIADRSDEDERSIMLGLIEKLDDRGRAARLLTRRGFDEDLIGSVLDQRFGEVD